MMVTNLMLIYQKEINLSSLDKFIKAIYHLTNLILIYQKKINSSSPHNSTDAIYRVSFKKKIKANILSSKLMHSICRINFIFTFFYYQNKGNTQ